MSWDFATFIELTIHRTRRTTSMLTKLAVFLLGLLVHPTPGLDDHFNYRSTIGRDFGPADWGKVQCDNIANCVRAESLIGTAIG